MILLLSPAKNLDFETEVPFPNVSKNRFLEESEILIKKLKTFNPKKIGKLMSISETLSELNFNRYQDWSLPLSEDIARQAIYAFKGEVYRGMDAYSFSKTDLKFAQEHVRILSGLYGVLKPMDNMLPYRLEMGTKLPIKRHKNLYKFWGKRLTDSINNELEKHDSKLIVNLASNEYFKSLQKDDLKGDLLTIHFKDNKNGVYKALMTYAKLARGTMTQFIVKNQLTNKEDLMAFDMEGYAFNHTLSTENEFTFTRG